MVPSRVLLKAVVIVVAHGSITAHVIVAISSASPIFAVLVAVASMVTHRFVMVPVVDLIEVVASLTEVLVARARITVVVVSCELAGIVAHTRIITLVVVFVHSEAGSTPSRVISTTVPACSRILRVLRVTGVVSSRYMVLSVIIVLTLRRLRCLASVYSRLVSVLGNRLNNGGNFSRGCWLSSWGSG